MIPYAGESANTHITDLMAARFTVVRKETDTMTQDRAFVAIYQQAEPHS
jgi:hypothetical protein